MAKACGKAGRIATRGAAFGKAFLSGVMVLGFLVLGRDGISLNLLSPAVTTLIEQRTGAEEVSFRDLILARDELADDSFRLDVRGLRLKQAAGSDLYFPSVSVRLDGHDLLKGRASPSFIEVSGATIDVTLQENNVAIGGTAAGTAFDLEDLVEGARAAGFEGAILRNLSISYQNEWSGGEFQTDGAIATVRSDGDQYVVRLEAAIGDGALDIGLTASPSTGEMSTVVSMERAPAEALLAALGDRVPAALTVETAISGTVTAAADLTDGLSDLGLALYADEGRVSLGGRAFDLAELTANAEIDPASGVLSILTLSGGLGGHSGTFSGIMRLIPDDRMDSTKINFDLDGRDLTIAGAGFFEDDIPLDNAKLSGGLSTTELAFSDTRLVADYFGKTLTTTFAGRPLGGGFEVTADVEGTLTPQEVLRGWPVIAGAAPRNWVVQNLSSAALRNVDFEMSWADRSVRPSILLTFEADGGVIQYVPGMSLARGVSADVHLTEEKFTVLGGRGRVGDVDLSSVSVNIGPLARPGAAVIVDLILEGEAPSVLSILDEDPLRLITAARLDHVDFDGQAEFALNVFRPIGEGVTIDDYRFSGEGTFTDLSADGLIPRLPIGDAQGAVRLTPSSLAFEGQAEVDGVPADFLAEQRFGRDGQLSVLVDTVIDGQAADQLGLPLRQIISGAMPIKMHLSGQDFLKDLLVEADLTNVAVRLPDGTMLKERSLPGTLSMTLLREQDSDRLTVVSAEAVAGEGRVTGGGIYDLQEGVKELRADILLPDLFDVMLDIAPKEAPAGEEPSGSALTLKGAFADLSLFIDDAMRSSAPPAEDAAQALPPSVSIDLALDRAHLGNGVFVENVVAEGVRQRVGMVDLAASGTFADGGNLEMTLSPDAADLGQVIRIRTDRFGAVLEGLFGLAVVADGDGLFEATALKDGSGLAGRLFVDNFSLKDTPTVARILSLGSLEGLEAALNGDGIPFAELRSDVQFQDGTLRLVDARMTGDALGLSAQGTVDFSAPEISLRGAVAPAYRINSFLGRLPAVGDLLVSRRGEGVFAFSYGVEGPMTEPVVTVNALTALTPGILRRVFEPVEEGPPTTADILEAAEAAAQVNTPDDDGN